MSTLAVKNWPEQLHARLRAQAQEHHRSMTKEVIALIEHGLLAPNAAAVKQGTPALPKLRHIKGGPLTFERIASAVADGRK